ncbi:MAG: cation transporter, partial [Candidatus Obscuribacterales bacterium]|nr:cation transporter [Candidatus Obscuribacterales bacterium]
MTRLDNLRQARGVFWQTLWLNLLVSTSKLICGFYTNTLSMVADGFHSLLDASSNVLGIVGLTISLAPPDEGHPYGHRKFEALAAIGISFLMFLAGSEVLKEAMT